MAKLKVTPFNQWETTIASGNEVMYFRMGKTQFTHPACTSLNHAAFRLLMLAKFEAKGQREFTLPYSVFKGYFSKGGFQKAVNELCEHGIIEVAEHNKHRRIPNLYRFSEAWKTYKPPP